MIALNIKDKLSDIQNIRMYRYDYRAREMHNITSRNDKIAAHLDSLLCLFYSRGLALMPAWISNHMSSKVWDGITYHFPNFSGCTVEVWQWISNFIPHFIMGVITYPR